MSVISVRGQCHCGAVKFTVATTPEVELLDCNCSICSMSGYQHLTVDADALSIEEGEAELTTYTFNTGTAAHTFCPHCGIKPFYVPRSYPQGYSVNFRCLDPSAFRQVKMRPFDGQNWEQTVAALRSTMRPGDAGEA